MSKQLVQTVYIPTRVEDELPEENGEYAVLSKCNVDYPLESYDSLKFQNGNFQQIPNWINIHWLKPKEGIFFTVEEYNKHIKEIIEETLKNGVEKAELEHRIYGVGGDYKVDPMSMGQEVLLNDITIEFPTDYVAINNYSITKTSEETYLKYKT